ncbi:MAG: flagellar hook-associated protein FlgL [Gammaproteobacteria bacterium]|nr:flagellar hook-associated protein FlgL [Gammaproteobacteria bacterium]
MRISTAQLFQQSIQQIQQRQADINELVEKISSGRAQLRPSDDPFVAARSLEMQQKIARTDQFQENIVLARTNLATQDTVLQDVNVALQRVRELAVQANNASLTAENRAQIAAEVNERISELRQLANTVNADGDFLYAGFRGDTEPFATAVVGALSYIAYQGDDGSRFMQVGDKRQLQTSEPGSDVFQRIRSNNALLTETQAANLGTGQIAPATIVDPTRIGEYAYTFTGAAARNDIMFLDDMAGGQDGVTFTLQGRTYELDVGGGGVLAGNIGVAIAANDPAATIAGLVQAQLAADVTAGDLNNITVTAAGADVQIMSDVATGTTTHTDVATVLATNYAITPAGQTNVSTVTLDGVTYEFRFDNEAALAGNVKVSLGALTAGTTDDQASNFAAAINAQNAGGNTTYSAVADANVTAVQTGAQHNYRIVIKAGGLYDVVDDTLGLNVITDATYTPGQLIAFNGIETAVIGTPNVGDSFSISAGTHQDIFTTVATFAHGLRDPIDDTVTAERIRLTLEDLDAAIDHVSQQQANVGGRLNALETQQDENAAFNLQLRESLSDIADLDYADAVARLEYSLFVLQAAQQSFARVESVSLFDFIG